MEQNQITVQIKYQSLDYYGKSSQVSINVPANITLSEFKQRVAMKLKTSPENQSIGLKTVNRIIPLEDDSAKLSDLGIKNHSKLFLEQINIQENMEENSSDDEPTSPKGEDKTAVAQDASLKLSKLQNPKYFMKLGFMKKQLTGMQDEDIDDSAALIDELIEKIKFD
jgi:hypothetical protein